MNSFKIVSFYTKKTGYEKEAKKLKRMLSSFDLDWYIEGIESRGSWQANTYYKAEFIKKMMSRYFPQGIVWLDVDSVLYDYPEIFDSIDADLGVHYIDWQKYGKSKYLELSTSAMFIKNNEKMKWIIDEWIEENGRMISTGIWEQKNLQRILENRKGDIKIINLPAEYCKIFDLMSQVENPVIEQMQVSRKYKAEVNRWL